MRDAGAPDVVVHPAPVSDLCAQGEANLLKLGCKDDRGRLLGGPDLHNVPWSVVCRQDQAHNVNLQPACMAGAKSCEEVTSCR